MGAVRFSDLGLCNCFCVLVTRRFLCGSVLACSIRPMVLPHIPADPASDCASPCSRLHHSSAQSQLDQEDARHAANRPMWTAGCAHDGGDHISALIADRTQKLTPPTHRTQKRLNVRSRNDSSSGACLVGLKATK